MNNRWYLFLACGLLISLNISQSLIDLFQILIIATTLYTAFKLKENPFKFIPKSLFYTLAAFFIATVFSYIFGVNEFNDLKINGLLEYRWALTFLCFISLLTNTQWNEKIFKNVLLTFTAANVINFIYYFIHGTERATGLFRHPMFYAQNLAPLLLILLNIYFYLMIQRSKNTTNDKQIFFIALFNVVLATVLLLLTQTRGVWLGFAAAGFLNLFFLKRKLVVKIVSLAVIAVTVIILFSPKIRDRIMMNNNTQSYSKESRMAFWRGNIELFKQHPLFGVGYNINNRLFFDELNDQDKKTVLKEEGLETAHAHNQYIQYLAGTGAFGFLAYLSFISVILLYAIRAIKQTEKHSLMNFLAIGLFLGLVCFLISGLTECNFSIAKNRSLFLFISAAAITLALNKKEYS